MNLNSTVSLMLTKGKMYLEKGLVALKKVDLTGLLSWIVY